LICIFAWKPIRIEGIEPINDTCCGLVPESLKTWACQDVPAVAIIHEAKIGIAFQAVARNPLCDRLKLAGDSVLLLLLVPGHPAIEPDTKVVLGHGCSSSSGLKLETPDGGRTVAAESTSWSLQRLRDNRDQRLICKRDQLILKTSELEMAGDGGRECGLP
jgi:hypothetical protein